jgi:hypothetical protein
VIHSLDCKDCTGIISSSIALPYLLRAVQKQSKERTGNERNCNRTEHELGCYFRTSRCRLADRCRSPPSAADEPLSTGSPPQPPITLRRSPSPPTSSPPTHAGRSPLMRSPPLPCALDLLKITPHYRAAHSPPFRHRGRRPLARPRSRRRACSPPITAPLHRRGKIARENPS